MPNSPSNGQPIQPTDLEQQRHLPTSKRFSAADSAAPSATFSWNEAKRPCVRLRMAMPALLFGLGTTGSKIVHAIIQELRYLQGRLPQACDYLLIDGASPEAGMDKNKHIPLSVSGCGTNKQDGEQAFLGQYGTLRKILRQMWRDLTHIDDIPVDHTSREATAFYVIGGSGGSSSGFQQLMVTLTHDVARELRIQNPRVRIVQCGPDIALRDIHRSPIPEQQFAVPDLAAGLLSQILSDLGKSAVAEHKRHDGTTFCVRRADRIYTTSLVDQSNGAFELLTVADFVEAVAQACVLEWFTEAGKYVLPRKRDNEGRKISGRALF